MQLKMYHNLVSVKSLEDALLLAKGRDVYISGGYGLFKDRCLIGCYYVLYFIRFILLFFFLLPSKIQNKKGKVKSWFIKHDKDG